MLYKPLMLLHVVMNIFFKGGKEKVSVYIFIFPNSRKERVCKVSTYYANSVHAHLGR